MSSPQTQTTDRNVEERVNVVNDDDNTGQITPKVKYAVVFFAKYDDPRDNGNTNQRPPVEEITNFFNNYGTVHHVNCPEGRNYAFVFMSSLNTPAEHRRTRTTISKIISDMTPQNRFRITVASSNHNQNRNQNQYNQNQYNQNQYSHRYQPVNRQNHYSSRNYDQNYDGYDTNYSRNTSQPFQRNNGYNQNGSYNNSGVNQRPYNQTGTAYNDQIYRSRGPATRSYAQPSGRYNNVVNRNNVYNN